MERGAIEAYLWLGLAGVLLVLLVTAFGYLLVLRRREWLRARLRHDYVRRFDAWMTARFPRLWKLLKSRFSPKAWYGLLLTLAALTFVSLVFVFAAIAASWRLEAGFHEVDRAVNEALVGALSAESISFLRFMTHFGDTKTAVVLIAALAVFFAFRREKWHLVALFFLEGLGAPLLVGLKWVFGRARPESTIYPYATGYSFPSGHSFTATVLYGFLIFLTWRYFRSHAVRIPATIVLTLIIVMVALSRVVLSVHWVSDVLGGVTIGTAWLVGSLVATRALKSYRQPGAPL